MTVGENIRKIRKEKGLTQKALGQLCNINESQIRRYELGLNNSNPKRETLQKIANALGVSIYELTGELQEEIALEIISHNCVNSVLILLEKSGYQILRVPCLYNHGDWTVKTTTLDEPKEEITAAFNERLQIITRGCMNYRMHKMYCASCKNMQYTNYIIKKDKKKIVLTIDEMQDHIRNIVKYVDFLFSQLAP